MASVGKVFLFLLIVLSSFIWVGHTITAMTGGEKKAGAAVDISPEGGETIFWGKGRCYTCHSLGGQGSAVRCPNLGQFGDKFPMPIGARAVERAKTRSEETGEPYTATDYLIESLGNPGAYVVEGYKNDMAVVYAPPISLSLDEIKAVVLYLQSQGGDLDMEAIHTPTELGKKYYDRIAAASAAGGGDPGHGQEVFEDNCVECHKLKGEGGDIGPDLSAISEKGLKFIEESILFPARKISAGYETYVAVANDGRKTTGIKTRDEAAEIDITKADGEAVTIARSDLKELTKDEGSSVMPEDLTEAMTVKDYQDVLSYLIMQKGKKENEK
ncbi:MAG: c-type cytochrome [Gammaproteobacteria bacterium]|nr:c-type cytochrome [Gammaproteobacteria bacterium]